MHLIQQVAHTLGLWKPSPDEAMEHELARDRLKAQERRVHALDRAVEVIQRALIEEPSRDSS